MAVRLVSRRGPFGITEKSGDRIGGPIGPRNQRGPLAFLFVLRRSPRVNEAASPADDRAYWASVMVGIGLGRDVGAVVYGLVSRLLGGGGTVQVGFGSA